MVSRPWREVQGQAPDVPLGASLHPAAAFPLVIRGQLCPDPSAFPLQRRRTSCTSW